MTAKKTAKKTGRPPVFTDDDTEALCAYLAEGMSLRKACSQPGMPSIQTVFNWMRTRDGFVERYARAKAEAADAFAEDMLDIADDPSGDYQRDRLRVDTRKWLASKLKPKKYGEKLELAGDESAPFVVNITKFSDAEKQKGDE